MVDEQPKPRTVACCGPFQHLEVTVRVAERGDGATADVLLDADGLAGFVVNEVEFGQSHDHGTAFASFVLQLDTAADNLLRRDAVDPFRPRTHELNAAARDDECLKSVVAKVGQ